MEVTIILVAVIAPGASAPDPPCWGSSPSALRKKRRIQELGEGGEYL